jgi:probable metal-binding protein
VVLATRHPIPKIHVSPIAIHGSDIIDLVTAYPDGIRLSQLAETVAKRFGLSAGFHTGSRVGLDLDGLLVALESRHKLRIVKGVMYPGGSPVCVR